MSAMCAFAAFRTSFKKKQGGLTRGPNFDQKSVIFRILDASLTVFSRMWPKAIIFDKFSAHFDQFELDTPVLQNGPKNLFLDWP
jgi:hypothetical protein